jgi:Predicted Fe-S oxidoreductases
VHIDSPYIQIEPTTRCNFTCGFCAGRHMRQGDLDFQRFRSLVDKLKNPLHIELQGEGEPLLHPDFFAMVAYLRERFPAVKISTITNGSLLNDDNIERILEARIDSLMISLESADEQIFQSIRGGKLERVKRGVQKLMQRKRQTAASTPTVGFSITLLSSTCEQLDKIADLYDELELDGGMLLQPLQTMQTYRQFYDEGMSRNLLTREKAQSVNQIIASSADLRLKLATYQQQTHFYSALYGSVNTPTCPWLERGLYLAADGSLTSCCFIKDTNQHRLGDAEDNWSLIASRREALLQALKSGAIPPQCNHCGIAHKMQVSQSRRQSAEIPHER